MTHYNAVLPGFFSRGSEAAPVSLVDIARGPTGFEQRRSKRSRRLRRFNLGKDLREISDIYEVLSFFEVMNGPQHSFAMQNLNDYKSCDPGEQITMLDALIGVGDGSNLSFQFKKQYFVTLLDNSTIAIDRTIYLPVSGTVLVAVDGVLKTETTHYVVNYSTGALDFTMGNAPANLKDVTAGFHFNEKVRFDTQDLSQIMEFFKAGSVPSIPLVEVIDA